MSAKEVAKPNLSEVVVQEENDGPEKTLNEDAIEGEAPNSKALDAAPPVITRKAKDVTTYALDFLSHASNETLGACFVGLGATTYFVLGRVGLVLIGIVSGVVLHATWDGSAPNEKDQAGRNVEARKRREKGLDIVARVLDLRGLIKTEKSQSTNDVSDGTSKRGKEADYTGFQDETKDALEQFTDAVVEDYVKWWYSPILPKDLSFPSACRQTLVRFFLAISNQLARKRPADTFLNFLTNSSSIVIVFLSELSGALKEAPRIDCAEAVHRYVFDNPESSLANVLDQEQQHKKLKSVSDDILQSFLENATNKCQPVQIFLQQILAGLVLEKTIISCSRPEFINEWIIYALEDEQKSELVQAIDKGVSGATANGSTIKDIIPSDLPVEEVSKDSQAKMQHKRTVSRAEDAMEEAMQEAKRLSALIASEEASKARKSEDSMPSGPTNAHDTVRMSSEGSSNSINDAITSIDAREEEKVPVALPSEASDVTPTFTTFDQILSSQTTALQSGTAGSLAAPSPMTLHNATVSIFDDAVPGEKSTIKAKPTIEYLLQIEPASSQYPGWMIARKYPDFETMHEVLRRIAVISGVTAFTQRNQVLPSWKNKTKATLRIELEAYLRDALSFARLAESEGMKRFLEKDQGLNGSSPGTGNKGGFAFPSPAAFETMGKGMLDVLASAPKGVAGGGKAVVGGVAGVFGGIGQKKAASPSPMGRGSQNSNTTTTAIPRTDSNTIPHVLGDTEEPQRTGDLEGSERSSSETRDPIRPPLPARPQDSAPVRTSSSLDTGTRTEIQPREPPLRTLDKEQSELNLPPPPSEIDDDYKGDTGSAGDSLNDSTSVYTPTSTHQSSVTRPPETASPSKQRKTDFTPLTIQETSVAVELFFATINELYALSSAWTLRLTLLNAAKSFLLRPGNPNLEAIRQLLQSTLIESQTTDEAIATQIRTTRVNALPTDEELKAWPPLPSDEEKERMRKKARKLLVEKGMPAALTSVMGAAASGEALGKVFDCLQVSEVARGLVFALVLQAVRAVTQ